MSLTEWIWRGVKADYKLIKDELDTTYEKLWLIMIGAILLILVMWAINAHIGVKGFNFVFFFAGGFFLLFLGFVPKVIGLSAVVGLTVHGLQDKDLSQGAIKGIEALYKVVLGVVLAFWIASGLLSTWSFKAAPGAFFPIIAMVMILALLSAFFGTKMKKLFITVAAVYAIGVIVTATWSTFAPEEKASVREFFQEDSAPVQQTVVQQPIPRELVMIQKIDVPARGTASMERKLRCYIDSRTDAEVPKVIRTDPGTQLRYTSQLSEPKSITVWFYDESGDCTVDYHKLNALGAFK